MALLYVAIVCVTTCAITAKKRVSNYYHYLNTDHYRQYCVSDDATIRELDVLCTSGSSSSTAVTAAGGTTAGTSNSSSSTAVNGSSTSTGGAVAGSGEPDNSAVLHQQVSSATHTLVQFVPQMYT
jgi:hypothetical protein